MNLFLLLIANLYVTFPNHQQVVDQSQEGEHISCQSIILIMNFVTSYPTISRYYRQVARSPSTPMRTDTTAQPSTSPGPVTRR